MKIHLVIDRVTGQVNVQGRSGRVYSQAELEQAEEGVRKADPIAQAALDDINVEGIVEPHDLLHDCADCRAQMACGEQPQILAGEELEAALADVLGPRWRRRPRGRR